VKRLTHPARLLGAAAILGMLPLAASQLGAVTQFTPDQGDNDVRALEQEVAQLRNLVNQLQTSNVDTQIKLARLEDKVAPLETGIGRTARDFTIGGGDNNKTITMKLGRYYPTGIAMDGRDMVLTADTIDLRGKVVRISATTAISVNGGAVDIGGSSVNVKGSKDSVMKGSKVLGN